MSKCLGKLFNDHPLARYTSWRVGGPADICFIPQDANDLSCFLRSHRQQDLLWLGLGSNTLVRDGGFRGAAILTLKGLGKIQLVDDKRIQVQAGATCAKLAKLCAKQGFAAGAFFAGIPGTMGGALAMNAGAYGGETWRVVDSVETIDRQGVIRQRQACDFTVAYRQVAVPAGEYFLTATLKFDQSVPGVQASIKELLRARNASQPIGQFSCGSVFRNPEGDHAARLIEACGLKDFAIGGAYISPKHANFIINDGSATAYDIEQLIEHAAQQVKQQLGVQLKRECHIVGER